MRDPASVERQVATVLYCLQDQGRPRKMSKSFEMRTSTASSNVRRVCRVITNKTKVFFRLFGREMLRTDTFTYPCEQNPKVVRKRTRAKTQNFPS